MANANVANISASSSNPPPIPSRPGNWYLGPQQQQSHSTPLMAGGGMYNYYQQQPPNFSTSSWPSNQLLATNPADFLRIAEESSRNAFQSVDSVVSAFVSVANMLNSTHAAVFNTFRAVAGVVEQFRTLKHFFVSTVLLTLLRWLRFLWRRCLVGLRLRPRNYANSEAIWTSIQQQEEGTSAALSLHAAPRVNWPSLFFWLLALGGPFLIFKCIGQIAQSAAEARKWTKGEGEHYTAQALYDFNSANRGELSFSAFDMLRVAPKWEQPNVKDWLLASTFDGSKMGLVPINYIRLMGKCAGEAGNSPNNHPTQEATS